MPNRKQRRKAAAIARRTKPKPPAARATGARTPPTIRATARVTITGAESQTAEQPARFRMVANTGEPMRLWYWDKPVVIDLETADLSEQRIPALYDHWASISSVVGQVETLAIEDKQLIAAGIFTIPKREAEERPGCGEEVLRLAKAGYQWQASVGADSSNMETVEAGASGVANWGRKYPGPCVIARKARFREISFVVLGADRRTSVVTAHIKGSSPMTFQEWLLTMGFEDESSLSEVQRANLHQKYLAEYPDGDSDANDTATEETANAEGDAGMEEEEEEEPTNAAAQRPPIRSGGTTPPRQQPPRRPSDPIAARRAAEAAEERRIAAVRRICASAPNLEIEVASETGERQNVPLAAHAIAAGWDANRTELEVLRRRRPEAPAVLVRGRDRDLTLQAFEGAMLLRCGGRLDHPSYTSPRGLGVMASGRPKLPAWLRANINDAHRNQIMEAAQRYADMNAMELVDEAIRLDGRERPHGRSSRIQAAISGLSLTNAFTTSINAILLSTYTEAEDTTQGWVREQDVSDYRLQERPRPLKGGNLSKRPKGGTADHMTRDDVGESYRIAQYAGQIEIDEQDFINDNLGALSDLPVEMGYAAARLRPDLVYAILLDNPQLAATSRDLFNATDGNLLTGAALAAAKLRAAVKAMMLFRENSVNLNLMPTHLIVPPSLKHEADELIQSSTILISYGADDETLKERGSYNALKADGLTRVSDARLENGVTDPDSGTALSGSATTWYLACALAHTIEVGYLRGTGRSPRVRSWKHTGEGKYGMGWDIDLSIGAAPMDWKGLVQNTA